VVLNSLPSGSWTLTRTPGGTTTSGSTTSVTISGLSSGTYTYTVTNSSGCTSGASADVVINTQPASPAAPVQSIDCSLGFDHAIVTVTSPTGSGYEYRIDAGTYQTATSFAGIVNGNHTITVKNSSGCTTTGASFAVTCGCINPPTVSLGSTSGSTCGTTAVQVNDNTFGGSATSVTIIENGSGSVIPASTSTTPFAFIYTPVAADAGKIITITVTTNNPLGLPCTATSATYILTVNAIPSKPAVGTITQPTCGTATGSVVLSGLPSAGWTLTRSPDGVITNGSGTNTTVSGLNPNTYTFTVTSTAGCTSAFSNNVVINAQPPTPTAPAIGEITQPTCALSTGSVVLTGLPSTGNWTVTRNPGGTTKTGSGTTTTMATIPAGTFTFTVTNSYGCISESSADVIIDVQPVTPAAPSVGTITPPTCSVSTGSVMLLGLPASGTWTLTRYPGAITTTNSGTSITVSGLSAGIYNFTVTSAAGCVSVPSANVVIPAQPPTPSAPVVGAITQPTYSEPTGSVLLNSLPSGSWVITRSPGAVTTAGSGTSKTITGLPAGVFTFTVTNSIGCTSSPSGQVIISTPGVPDLIITDPEPVCSPNTVDITAEQIIEGSTPGLIYTYWTDADATTEYTTPAEATGGTYYIKGTTVSGYFDIKPVVVTVDQMPVADAGPDQVLDYQFSTALNAVLGENETGLWSLVSGTGNFMSTDDPLTTVTSLSVGDNILSWTVSAGVCPAASDEVTITVHDLIIPTLITPNGDPFNEYFVLRGLETLGKTEVTIFDRRGAQVYKNTNYDNSWNGLDYNGNELPDDTYFYVVKSQNGKSLSGYIVIRR
jgi:gliding motility-associated-like protein